MFDQIRNKACSSEEKWYTSSFGTANLSRKYHLYLGDFDVDYHIRKINIGDKCKVTTTFIVDDPYNFTSGAIASVSFMGRNVTVHDDVWLKIRHDVGRDFSRKAEWKEEIYCEGSVREGENKPGLSGIFR